MSIIQGTAHSGAGYNIERSLRFNSADSAYLNRTPASASNRKTWTWSGWVKRTKLSTTQVFFGCEVATTDTQRLRLMFVSDDTFAVQAHSLYYRQTSQVLRDVSSWYHIVVACDTTQATANDRFKVYINGIQVTTFATTNNPTQNADLGINQAAVHRLGSGFNIGTSTVQELSDIYLTEINFIDGQALTPSSFGETDPNTGVWRPKKYTGTYGTNGFYLNFADNSGTTSTTLGKDSSGNGNNWTPNNFSVTAGAGNDSLVDTPTPYGSDTGAGGEVRGNYATLNPLWFSGTTTTATLTNGNLDVAANSAATYKRWAGTFAVTSGKWYFEFTRTDNVGVGNQFAFGVSDANSALSTGVYSGNPTSSGASSVEWALTDRGYACNTSTYTNLSGTIGTIVQNSVVQVCIDMDAKKIWFGINNTFSGSPSAGTGEAFSNLPASVTPIAFVNAGSAITAVSNFGQRPFAYTAPSGFKALCTTNLPTPTIGATSTTQANDYFDVITYTGDGTSPRSITGLQFQPDFVWGKSRSNAYNNWLFDAVRGVSLGLKSNSTDAQITNPVNGYISAFNSDGFSVTAGTTDTENLNGNTRTYVAWNWKANGAGSTNTAGTITSTVSANTTAGFSIVTYTGNGTGGATVGHGLGVAPKMVIVKRRDSATNGDWFVWTTMTGAGNNLFLNLTNASAAAAGPFNSTAPSSTVITLGTSTGTNANTSTYVAYCFAEIAGYSAFGSYTGNGSTDGVFVYTGFRPRFVMVKRTDTAGYDWFIYDSARDTFNVASNYLRPNLSNAEDIGATYDILSNGFKNRNTFAAINANGGTYIYMALAENPFKYSLAR